MAEFEIYPPHSIANVANVKSEVDQLLHQTPSYHYLDAATQAALRDSLGKVAGYLASGQGLATQMAGVDALRSQLGGQGGPAPSSGAPRPVPSPSNGAAPAPQGAGGGSATGRVGEVARATLSAIDFPSFVGSLIQGTFQAIVDASIQQMEAYAELLKNVAGTIDSFMDDHVSEGSAKDYLADKYSGFLVRDTSSNRPVLKVNPDHPDDAPMPSFFQGLGFESPSDIDDEAMDNVVVPATRRTMAEQRQQTLATMVLMGINRIVVDKGEITAKLQFHIDATEAAQMRFDQTKTTAGNMASRGGRQPFTANAVMVNTSSLNAQSDINVRADLTGQVKVEFRSETFPLERFADSAAIQLINSHARVPEPRAAAGPAGTAAPASAVPASGAPVQAVVAGAPAPATPVAPAAAPVAPAPAPATQPAAGNAPATTVSLGAGAPAGQSLGADPWAPRAEARR